MNFAQVFNRFPFSEALSWGVAEISSAQPSLKTIHSRLKTLESAREGQTVTIAGVKDPAVAAQLLRLGVMAGERIRVLSKTPGDGPIVIQVGDNAQSELAIGHAYAQEIEIQDKTFS